MKPIANYTLAQPGFLRRRSLTTTIILPFSLIIALAVGLVIWLSWHSSQIAVYNLSSQLRHAVTNRVYQHLENYMVIPPRVNQTFVDAYQTGALDLAPSNFLVVGNVLSRQQRMYDLSFINFADPQSNYIGCGYVDDRLELNERRPPEIDGVQAYTIDQNGDRGPKLKPLDVGVNPVDAPWYHDAVAAGKPIWSPIYNWAPPYENIVAISSSFPIYSKTDQLVGVIGIDFYISDLDNFLKTVQVGQTGEIFIIERSGQLVASSSDAPSFKLVAGTGERLNAVESQDALISNTAQYLTNHFGSYANIQAAIQLDYLLQNQKQFVQVMPFQDAYGLDWLIVVAVPEADFMGQINAGTHTTILLALGALVIAVFVGAFVTSWVTTPLRGLSAAAMKITAGEWDVSTLPTGYTNEIGKLAQAFQLMVERLKATLESLEQRVAERTAALQQANQELVVAKHAAEEANNLKTHFLANMSHELRTPLNAILNFTRFLSKERYGVLTPPQQDLQQRVLANGEHLLGLINDILDLAKIESGRIELFYEEVDLVPILQGVMTTAVGLTKDKDVLLTLEPSDGLPLVRADKTRIRQVLLNLLSNAAKFTPEGEITIRTRVTSAMVEIAVIDTGIGIAPEHQALIFEEFRQVQDDQQREHQGTGLGLPISKRLVEMHGGNMGVISQPGQGATFWFTLPLLPTVPVAPAAPPPATPPVVSSPTPTTADPAPGTHDIVVVDDDPAAQEILSHYLEGAGYTVQRVTDSRRALETITQARPRLVILDVLMPYYDGWDVLIQMKSTAALATIPILLCSIVERRRLGWALGADDYLVKPIQETALLARVQQLLTHPDTVLVIDDDPDARQVIRTMLEANQYQVIEAADGETGLALLGRARPALLVLDLLLPGMDGFAVLEQVRADPQLDTLPVLVVTAKDLEGSERTWLQAHTLAWMQKSQFSDEQFLAYIAQMMARREHPGHGESNHVQLIRLQQEIDEHRRLQATLEHLATSDTLTGLNNRRRFFTLAEQELERARRYQRPLAIIMFDIDYFKQINDTHGHFAGDQALVAVTRCLQRTLREPDIPARYGGDEFVILLPETDAAQAGQVAERLRTAIAGQPLVYNEEVITVTISLGIAARAPAEDIALNVLLHMADQALYTAKQSGRNQVSSRVAPSAEASSSL